MIVYKVNLDWPVDLVTLISAKRSGDYKDLITDVAVVSQPPLHRRLFLSGRLRPPPPLRSSSFSFLRALFLIAQA